MPDQRYPNTFPGHSHSREYQRISSSFRKYDSSFRGRGGYRYRGSRDSRGFRGSPYSRGTGEYRRPYGAFNDRRRYRSRSKSPHLYRRREKSVDLTVMPKYSSDVGDPSLPMYLNAEDLVAELKRRSKLRRKALMREYQVNSFENVLSKCNSHIESQENDVEVMINKVLKHNNLLSASMLDANVDKNVEVESFTSEPILSCDEESADSTDATSHPKKPINFNIKPHNDYSQNYVDSDLRPHNFVHDAGYENRFREYPKLRELIRLKDELVKQTNTPPMYMYCDLTKYNLKRLKSVFDVILVSPPLDCSYAPSNESGALFKRWSFDELRHLKIKDIAAGRGFIFMWCGTSENVDDCRECIQEWGYRRCEDICWIKTNTLNRDTPRRFEPGTLFHRTKEHCLVGIHGTVKRSQDGNFIHANTDLDLILSEEPEFFSEDKPEEIFKIIEHFCLGRRRLHLFGTDKDIRPGWLTIGPGVTGSNFDYKKYCSWFAKDPDGSSIPDGPLTGCSERVESLRPKTPPPRNTEVEYKDPIPNTIIHK